MPTGTMLNERLMRLLRLYVRYSPGTLGKIPAVGVINRFSQRNPFTATATTKEGSRYIVETDDYVQSYLWLFGIWEPNISAWMSRTLRPGDGFIDVGANVGYYSILASRLVGPEGRIVAIEPSPDSYGILRGNLAFNRVRNVRTVNIAAAARRERELAFYQPDPMNRGRSTGVVADLDLRPAFSSDAETLLEILRDEELRTARIIKIDVEGLELAVLEGLLPAADRFREDVEFAVEISPDLLEEQGIDPSEIFKLLASYGYHPYEVPNRYFYKNYIGRRPELPPTRSNGEVTRLCDFIFSRRDVAAL